MPRTLSDVELLWAIGIISLAAGQLFTAIALIEHGFRIGLLKEKIMALADDLAALNAQLVKVRDEISTRLNVLEAAVVAAGTPDPAVTAAVDALRATVQGLDDITPDADAAPSE